MNPEPFWSRFSPLLREALDLRPPSLEEIAEELESIPQNQLSDDGVQQFLSRDPNKSNVYHENSPAWLDGELQVQINEELLATSLHRNEGEEDSDIDALLDEHRKEALNDEDQEDDRKPREGTPPS